MDFNIEANIWDNDRRVNRAKIIAEEINSAIQIESHYNVLEFGCGTGLISFNLYNKFSSGTLVDTSTGMINVLNDKIRESQVKNMTAIQIDINKGFPLDETFDVIYTSMALHHIIDTETTLRNLFKLLNIGGHLCIVELVEDDGSFHNREKDFAGHNGFNQDKLKSLLNNTGLQEVVSNVFYTDENIINDIPVKYSLFLMVSRKK